VAGEEKLTRRAQAGEVHLETREQWRAWLAAHHDTAASVWLVSWRRQTGRPAVSYDDAVLEALAFGWVDSTAGTVDSERSRTYFAPRRKGSGWARSNKVRVAALERDGLMTEAGRRVVREAQDDGSWTLLDDVEDLVVPPDLAATLEAHPGARSQWDAFPPGARRALLAWIVTAKRPATREKRVAQTAAAAAEGRWAHERVPRA
jgi:uncharacterized protein YdeI (YjbR/CyaY-like superfamily)